MSLVSLSARRVNLRFVGIAAFAVGVICVGTAPSAPSAPSAPAELPFECTAGDGGQEREGISTGTSVYLSTHPLFIDYFATLGQAREQIRRQLREYRPANVEEDVGGHAVRCGTGRDGPAR